MTIFRSLTGNANARAHRGARRVLAVGLAVVGLGMAGVSMESSGAMAQSAYPGGPSSVAMTCAQALSFVTKAGGTVLATGGLTYDRYVRDRSFCSYSEVTKPAFVPTRDVKQCFVGYTCIDPSIDNGGRR
ncbi:hypothetical protein [Roseixanthobacter glucoisosaccharinicivorans]|uniref:hypothetical protein n=1 Tax=Roseixanthobacter glucoisosaccharinicivorans TaxID=3119923 RepID=UPI003726D87F